MAKSRDSPNSTYRWVSFCQVCSRCLTKNIISRCTLIVLHLHRSFIVSLWKLYGQWRTVFAARYVRMHSPNELIVLWTHGWMHLMFVFLVWIKKVLRIRHVADVSLRLYILIKIRDNFCSRADYKITICKIGMRSTFLQQFINWWKCAICILLYRSMT